MSKHPGPWSLGAFGFIRDDKNLPLCVLTTDDPETRAVLVHAAEMWEVLKSIDDVDRTTPHGVLYVFVDKIRSEIAGKQP